MKKDLPSNEFRIAKSIALLLQKLPFVGITSTIMEQELVTRFIEPALSPLFEDNLRNIMFRWTATINDECKVNSSSSISQDRPDACISNLDGMIWGNTRGFGEVKCFSQVGNTFAIAKDLVRLALFSKNAIDTHGMHGILAFQAIGRHVFFYLTTLLNDALYVMMEIGKIEIPSCIKDLPAYILIF